MNRLARRRAADHPISLNDAQGLLFEAFGAANQAVRRSWKTLGASTGADCTLSLVLVVNDQAVIASIGDVYTWVLRKGKIEAVSHRDKRVGLVGGKVTVAAKVDKWKAQEGDRLLIGSRGLWTEVSEEQMALVLGEEADPRAAVRRLVRAANDAGGGENITAMVIDL